MTKSWNPQKIISMQTTPLLIRYLGIVLDTIIVFLNQQLQYRFYTFVGT